jgi:lipoprotein-releasing system permease protein
LYKLLLGFRYLRSHWVVYLAIAGVAVGVAVLLVVTSVMGGFSRDLRQRIRGVSSHITVSRGQFELFGNYEKLMTDIRACNPHIVACAPHLEWLSIVEKPRIIGTHMIGIDPQLEPQVGDFSQYVMDPASMKKFAAPYTGAPPTIIGSDLFGHAQDEKKENWPFTGMILTLATTRFETGMKLSSEFSVVGGFSSGMAEYDSTFVFVPLAAAQDLLKAKGRVTKICVRVDDYEQADEVKQDIKRAVGPGFMVRTWEEEKQTLLRAVALERGINAVILFFIVIVAGFLIMAVLNMVVTDKTKDVGILRSIGASVMGVFSIFMFEACLIGFLGSMLGLAMGRLVSSNLNPIADFIYRLTGFHPFPKDVYMLESIPCEWNWLSVGIIVGSTMFASVVFSLYPVIRAARMNPVDALRYE